MQKLLDNHYHTKSVFIGVYSNDTLPAVGNISAPFCLIINSDNSVARGTHWAVVFRNINNSTSYFCSLGKPPTANVASFISDMGGTYIMTGSRVQSTHSSTCGYFCCYYIDQKSRGYSDSDIYKTFSFSDYRLNDRMVVAYTYYHIKRNIA